MLSAKRYATGGSLIVTARDLHDECNRAVDKYWSKPNKKGDVFCIFDDASDDETVAALGT